MALILPPLGVLYFNLGYFKSYLYINGSHNYNTSSAKPSAYTFHSIPVLPQMVQMAFCDLK